MGCALPGGKPDITYVVLRVWLVWRASAPACLDAKTTREKWRLEEILSLKVAISSFGVPGGGTGPRHTDDLINKW